MLGFLIPIYFTLFGVVISTLLIISTLSTKYSFITFDKIVWKKYQKLFIRWFIFSIILLVVSAFIFIGKDIINYLDKECKNNLLFNILEFIEIILVTISFFELFSVLIRVIKFFLNRNSEINDIDNIKINDNKVDAEEFKQYYRNSNLLLKIGNSSKENKYSISSEKYLNHLGILLKDVDINTEDVFMKEFNKISQKYILDNNYIEIIEKIDKSKLKRLLLIVYDEKETNKLKLQEKYENELYRSLLTGDEKEFINIIYFLIEHDLDSKLLKFEDYFQEYMRYHAESIFYMLKVYNKEFHAVVEKEKGDNYIKFEILDSNPDAGLRFNVENQNKEARQIFISKFELEVLNENKISINKFIDERIKAYNESIESNVYKSNLSKEILINNNDSGDNNNRTTFQDEYDLIYSKNPFIENILIDDEIIIEEFQEYKKQKRSEISNKFPGMFRNMESSFSEYLEQRNCKNSLEKITGITADDIQNSVDKATQDITKSNRMGFRMITYFLAYDYDTILDKKDCNFDKKSMKKVIRDFEERITEENYIYVLLMLKKLDELELKNLNTKTIYPNLEDFEIPEIILPKEKIFIYTILQIIYDIRRYREIKFNSSIKNAKEMFDRRLEKKINGLMNDEEYKKLNEYKGEYLEYNLKGVVFDNLNDRIRGKPLYQKRIINRDTIYEFYNSEYKSSIIRFLKWIENPKNKKKNLDEMIKYVIEED